MMHADTIFALYRIFTIEKIFISTDISVRFFSSLYHCFCSFSSYSFGRYFGGKNNKTLPTCMVCRVAFRLQQYYAANSFLVSIFIRQNLYIGKMLRDGCCNTLQKCGRFIFSRTYHIFMDDIFTIMKN